MNRYCGMQGFELSQPVWVESVTKWASLSAPDPLAADETNQLCRIQLPLAARVQLLLQQYPHLVNHPDVGKAAITNRAMVARN